VNGGVPGYTFIWNNGATTEDLADIPAGIYTCIITDANGCTEEITVNVVEENDLESAFEAGDVLCFGDENGYAEVSVTGGEGPYDYQWSNSANTSAIDGLSGGSYTCTVTDQMGCVTVVEVFIDEPEAIEQNVETFYNGKQGIITVDLSVHGGTPGYSYLWNNGYTGEDLFNVPSGTYQCTITDDNGCVIVTDPIRVYNPKDALDPDIQVKVEGSPALQPFTVWIDKDDNQEVRLMLFNVAGQLITSKQGTGESYEFNLTNQGAGIYFLSVFSEDTWVRTERIIIAQ
jgi:hypothetical protein